MEWAGFHFASPAELIFVVAMGLPLLFFAACALYLLLLLSCGLPLRHRLGVMERTTERTGGVGDLHSPAQPGSSRSAPAPATTQGGRRFVVLIPAHNEELLLGSVLDLLRVLDYPRSLYDTVVIADNCTDRTAVIARNHRAITLERHNQEQIGKGYALEWALQHLLHVGRQADADPAADPDQDPDVVRAGQFDAVVILDADTVVSRNLLQAFDQALQAGDRAVQARYDVLNAADSWRTKLMSCALALAHVVKPLGREKLGLSDGLKGNGMCFAREVVELIPWSGESITEDIEYTLRLCRAGHRVAFLPEATVWAQMPTTGEQATDQRKRWEGGRYRLLFQVAPRLLVESFRTRNRLLLDRAIELIIPPFAEMFALPLLLLVVSLLAGWLGGWHWALLMAAAWGLILAVQTLYLGAGMWLARMPVTVTLSLLYAPIYILWKFSVYLFMAVSRSSGGWKRTERHQL
jgi:cellulose synthase/poly-beta-1,6-N-acetylglucosamine synthase-like glycosyltransferase